MLFQTSVGVIGNTILLNWFLNIIDLDKFKSIKVQSGSTHFQAYEALYSSDWSFTENVYR